MKTLPSDPFLRAYLTAAFWTFDDNAPPGDYESSGRATRLFPRLTNASFKRAEKDCADFLAQAGETLWETTLTVEQAGHDFWLTRNGHGTGFWDRGLGDVGDKLADLAKSFGECNLTASRGHLYLE